MSSLQHFLLDNHCYHTVSVTRGREPVFADPTNAEILAASIRYASKRQANVLAWAVMPDHLHMVLVPREGYRLPQNMQGIKGVTARRVNHRTGAGGQLWQQGYFDRVVRTERHLLNVIRYVNANPLEGEILLGDEKVMDLEAADVVGWLGGTADAEETSVRQWGTAMGEDLSDRRHSPPRLESLGYGR